MQKAEDSIGDHLSKQEEGKIHCFADKKGNGVGPVVWCTDQYQLGLSDLSELVHVSSVLLD